MSKIIRIVAFLAVSVITLTCFAGCEKSRTHQYGDLVSSNVQSSSSEKGDDETPTIGLPTEVETNSNVDKDNDVVVTPNRKPIGSSGIGPVPGTIVEPETSEPTTSSEKGDGKGDSSSSASSSSNSSTTSNIVSGMETNDGSWSSGWVISKK